GVAPLSRTLLRLRHDLIISAGAAITPRPEPCAARLGPLLAQIGTSAGDYLRRSAGALREGRRPVPLKPVEAALQPYSSEMAALRSEGATRELSSSDVERI